MIDRQMMSQLLQKTGNIMRRVLIFMNQYRFLLLNVFICFINILLLCINLKLLSEKWQAFYFFAYKYTSIWEYYLLSIFIHAEEFIKTIPVFVSRDFIACAFAFVTAILTVAIPLSQTVIIRLIDRYNSDITVKFFKHEKSYTGIKKLSVINIIAILLFMFAYGDSYHSYHILFYFGVFILLLLSLWTIMQYIKCIADYSQGGKYVLEKILFKVKKHQIIQKNR